MAMPCIFLLSSTSAALRPFFFFVCVCFYLRWLNAFPRPLTLVCLVFGCLQACTAHLAPRASPTGGRWGRAAQPTTSMGSAACHATRATGPGVMGPQPFGANSMLAVTALLGTQTLPLAKVCSRVAPRY